MQPEDLATPVLVALILGLVFYAGYGWRILVERRLHNMPWLKKSNRKAAAAAAKSTKRPTIMRHAAEPLERQLPATDNAPLALAANPETPIEPNATEETDAPPLATDRRVLSLRRILESE